ncbi:MAG: hypothetical protein IPP96_16165 [Chitinophagaceae bacterium]|nr:hypothetical protein [Chitinophagaceae bacterium]
MRSLLWLTAFVVVIAGCNNSKEGKVTTKVNRIFLRTDSINVVKLSDTMLIYESICRGCKYESSVRFEISDSLAVVKLQDVITNDSNPDGMSGGNVGKELVLVPAKAGNTNIKLYKFLSPETAKEDSARFQVYTIEVKN